MAKKKTVKKKAAAKGNKAQAMRDYLQANPQASNAQVAAGLKEQGIEISPNYVSVIKSQDKTRDETKTKKTKVARANGVTRRAGLGLEEIRQAASLIRSCGGVQGAKQALEAAEDVARSMRG